MAGSAAVLYHLSYKDPRIGTQHCFFFQIKPGLFAIVEIAINTATITSLFKVFIFTVHITFNNDNDNDNDDDSNDNNNHNHNNNNTNNNTNEKENGC